MAELCAMCQVRGVCGKEVDKSKPAVRYMNPVDKLTSTFSWPTIPGKYCYLCDKIKTGLIKRQDYDTEQVERQETFWANLKEQEKMKMTQENPFWHRL